ncbi:MAG: response regulator, partial [Verrucomicrobiota bacterium]
MSIITSLDLKAIEGSKILFTDDDLHIVTPIQQYFQAKGYKVDVATDGNEGLKKALANPPNLILRDVMMPGADG